MLHSKYMHITWLHAQIILHIQKEEHLKHLQMHALILHGFPHLESIFKDIF